MTRKKIAIHLHHMSSHITNGLFPAAAVMMTLYLFTGNSRYEATSFHCIFLGLFGMPIVYGSGLIDWRKRFKGRRTRIFDHKIFFGFLFCVFAVLAVSLRFSLGESIRANATFFPIYIALIYLLTILVAYLGHLGSKFI